MVAHIYASYKCSPVGFNLGSITYEEGRTDNYYLSYRKESALIYRIFEQGYISSAEGLLPNQNKWVLLIKNLAYTYSDKPDFGKTVDINIAFEFDTEKEYADFVSGYKSFNKGTISQKMAAFIIPDKENKEYALHIDAKIFNDFVKEIYSRKSEADIVKDCFELVTKADEKSGFDDKIQKLFALRFSRDNNKYFYPPKKKHNPNNRTAMNNHKVLSQNCICMQKYKSAIIIVSGVLGLSLLAGLFLLIFK